MRQCPGSALPCVVLVRVSPSLFTSGLPDMSNASAAILVVDDEELMRGFVVDALLNAGYRVEAASCSDQAREKACGTDIDLMVTDICLGSESGIELVREFATAHPLVPVILMTGYASQDYVLASRELDTCAFLTKPFTHSQLHCSVITGLEERRSRVARDESISRGDRDATCGLAGTSGYVVGLRRLILQVARGDFPIIIQGPSGSGKELVARAIHANSRRGGELMVPVNCAAIPESLQESEFFGHKKGAYTGAYTDREGIIGVADNSTLFLDEVGELTLATQSKLLRVLENKEYQPVGETRPRSVSMRVICATNRDLGQMVAQGAFREDLYYRLKGDVITTSALDEHREDIPDLVWHFLAACTAEGAPSEITREALTFLANRRWPGNIRELRTAVVRLSHAATGMRRVNLAVIEAVLHERFGDEIAVQTYRDAKMLMLEKFEREYFAKLLKRTQGNLTRAAEAAGLHRPNLARKLHTCGISPERYRR